jgi:hypothetical protein
MISVSTSSFNFPSHDNKTGDLLPGGRSEQETAQHESDAAAATRGKIDGHDLTRSQPNPSGSSSAITPPSALTSYFQLLFQGSTFPNSAGDDLTISVDNAKAGPDPRSIREKR